jgi:uncharacterized membrane protein
MGQDPKGKEADEQAELRLQIGLLAEQEATNMPEMLRVIHSRLGLGATAKDPELKKMIQRTLVELIADELKLTRAEDGDPAAERGPKAIHDLRPLIRLRRRIRPLGVSQPLPVRRFHEWIA